MRLVVLTSPGVLEFAYMWAPMFIGMDTRLCAELQKELGPYLEGKGATEEVLESVNDRAIDFLVHRFPHVSGLRDYLDALKYIQVDEDTDAG